MTPWKRLFKSLLVIGMILPLWGQQGEIVQLTKHIGFTLDAEENQYYQVYPEIANFESAQFFEINNNRIESRVSFVEYTRVKISKRAYTQREFIGLQMRIKQLPKITEEIRESFRKNLTYLRTKDVLTNIPTGQYVSVKHQNGKWVRGTLLSYKKERLLLQTPFAIKSVPITKMERINYRENIIQRPEWKLHFFGVAALLGLGLMESWNRQTSPAWGSMWHNRFLGAIFGLIAGAEVYDTSMILLSKKSQFGLTPAELEKINH